MARLYSVVYYFNKRSFSICKGYNDSHIYCSPDADGTCNWDTHKGITAEELSQLITADLRRLYG